MIWYDYELQLFPVGEHAGNAGRVASSHVSLWRHHGGGNVLLWVLSSYQTATRSARSWLQVRGSKLYPVSKYVVFEKDNVCQSNKIQAKQFLGIKLPSMNISKYKTCFIWAYLEFIYIPLLYENSKSVALQVVV